MDYLWISCYFCISNWRSLVNGCGIFYDCKKVSKFFSISFGADDPRATHKKKKSSPGTKRKRRAGDRKESRSYILSLSVFSPFRSPLSLSFFLTAACPLVSLVHISFLPKVGAAAGLSSPTPSRASRSVVTGARARLYKFYIIFMRHKVA